MTNLKVQGFFVLDVDVVALNNAGKSTISNNDNVVATKKVFKNNRPYAYVAGQAFGQWWRETLQKHFGWELSPVLRESKIAFTAANPLLYADDDIFGYMKAAKEAAIDESTGEVQTNAKGKEVMEDVTVTRVAALKKSAIVSIGPVGIAHNWSSMARQLGDSVPYVKEEYSAIMKGQFSLDLSQIGIFSTYNRTGFKNLTEKLKEYALQNGCDEIADPFVMDGHGLPQKLIRMSKDIRIKRSIDVIQALKVISGGAMQTNNMADVTPKVIILALMETGNHPFGHVFTEKKIVGSVESENQQGYADHMNGINFNIDNIQEVLADYKNQIKGTVFIGRRSGFMDEYTADFTKLENLGSKYPLVKCGSIGDALDGFCEQLKIQMK